MCPVYISTLILMVAFQNVCSGDPVMYFPPFEVRTVNSERPTFFGDIQPDRDMVVQQPMQLQPPRVPEQPVLQPQPKRPNLEQVSKPKLENEDNHILDNKNFTFTELINALTNVEENKEKHGSSRAAEYDYPEPPYSYRPPYQRPYPYGSYGYYQPPYQPYQPPPMYIHPVSVHSHKPSLPKKDPTSLLSPTSNKLANKVSGFISFLLALLTGSTVNSSEITGLKDVIINGVVKPLLLAKGGLKVLLNKLTIPVIALVLINIEVFITIWWLWEDSPEHPPPPYHPPRPMYGY